MSSDALTQIREWLAEEIENRKLLMSAMQATHADSPVIKEKQDTLAIYEAAAAAASKSQSDFEGYLASHGSSEKAAAIAKMWAGLKG